MISPGHGTRTASVICGYEPGKYKGVAPGLPVIPYRAVNGVDLTSHRVKRVAQSLSHAVQHRLCEVVSISLGCLTHTTALGKAVNLAYDNGTIVVAAAGQPNKHIVFPARYGHSIAVGGVTERDTVYHRYADGQSKYVDVWAPADPVPVASSSLNMDGDGGFAHTYLTADGTSYATAHVAGAAAMWLSYHYGILDEMYSEGWQRVEAFRTLLRESAAPKDSSNQPLQPPQTQDSASDSDAVGTLDIEALLNADLPLSSELQKRANLPPRMPDPPESRENRR